MPFSIVLRRSPSPARITQSVTRSGSYSVSAATFSARLNENSLLSWNTTEKSSIYSSYLYFLISIPLSVISPSVGSYSLQSSLTSVDFPQPFLPTRAIFSPIRHFRFMSLRVYSSLSGYLNQTCLNSNSYSLSSRFSVGIVPLYFSSGISRKSKYFLQKVGVIFSSP